jgi:CO/xanthine dehydrogenase Mo-binding subunit
MTDPEHHLLVEGEIPPRLEREFTVVGKEIDRVDGFEKCTGEALYSGDIKIEGMLYAKILRSPHAHARILGVNTDAAERLPGVRAVISKNNCPDWYTYWYTIKQTAFAGEIGYYGQEVAAVAADSIEIADRALRMIEVRYEVLPAVFDAESAMQPGAPIVPTLDQVDELVHRAPHSKPVRNVFEGRPTILKRGDVEKGFKEADVTVEGTYSTSFQFHATIQTRSCVAQWDGHNLVMHDSSQGPWQVRDDLSRSLKIPPENIRVSVKYMGGGFGSKAAAQRYEHFAAKLAMLTGKPVRLELTRPEEFLAHPHRQSTRTWIKIGARNDGKICAIQEKMVLNLGVGSTYGGLGDKGIEHAFESYDCPNAYCEQTGVHTNTPITGYMRTVMGVIGNFPVESAINELALKLGMDPAEVRLKNYTIYGDQEKKIKYSAKNLDRCIAKVLGESRWKESRKRYAEENATDNSPVKKGIGIATYMCHGLGLAPYKATAIVEMDRSGRAIVHAGFADVGGGQATMATMLVAEELGLEVGDVEMRWGDTESTEYSPGTHASRITAELGPALVQAAYLVRKQILEIASKQLGVPQDQLLSALGNIYSKSDPAKKTTFAEVCKKIPEGQAILGKGHRAPNPKTDIYKTFGAEVAEVEVDVDTGAVKVTRITSAHELGRAINPKLCRSQQYGAITMGLGFALYEDPVIDEKTGIMLNTDLHQYRTVSSLEVPEMEAFLIEAEDLYFAYSAKAVAEGPLLPVPAAVRSAILFATGAHVWSTPMTPDKVLRALEDVEVKAVAV